MKIQQFANFPSINTLKIAAISTLAIGATATISAAPAGAVFLTSGQLAINDGALNTTGTIPGPFTSTFNGTNAAIVSTATGSFAPLLLPLGAKTVTLDTVGFVLSGANYASTDSLVFNFGAAGQLTIASGSLFSNTPALAPNRSNFNYLGTAATFTNGADVSNLIVTSFNFDVDNLANTNPLNTSPNGSYSLVATAVPEPFTIIGTIIGGTAAFRMRKKLSN
jgi:hypothetical protein